MRPFLYTIWLLIPAFFFITALWGALEKLSNKTKRERPADFLKQGLFVLLVIGVAILIDQFVLEEISTIYPLDFMPLGFYQVILLPILLMIGAKLVGGSKEVIITKAPRPSGRKR